MQIIEQSHHILTPIDREAIYRFLELVGRTAYKSEAKITEDSAERFLRAIIKRGHESVLEHVSISVRFITDRGVTHELVRHRLASYTQESTRYVNYQKREMQFIEPVFWKYGSREHALWTHQVGTSEDAYNYLIEHGSTPQEARTVLPNSLKAEIVMTANIREWRHVLKLRTAKDAHPQMRALMEPLLQELKEKIPILFEDIGQESTADDSLFLFLSQSPNKEEQPYGH